MSVYLGVRVCVYHKRVVAVKAVRWSQIPGTGVTVVSYHVSAEPKPGSLQEQEGPLTTEPPVQDLLQISNFLLTLFDKVN